MYLVYGKVSPSDLPTHLPLLLFGFFRTLLRMFSFTVAFPILPRPHVHRFIRPVVGPLTFVRILHPVALVAFTGGPGLDPISLLLVVVVVAVVLGAGGPREDAFPVFLPLVPQPLILIS